MHRIQGDSDVFLLYVSTVELINVFLYWYSPETSAVNSQFYQTVLLLIVVKLLT